MSTDLKSLAEEANVRLADASAQEVLAWARETFGDDLVVTASMADGALPHLAAEAAPGVDVLFLDTGYHFIETIGTRDAVAQMLPINLINATPLQTIEEQNAEYGEKLYERRPDQCCALRKVEPLNRHLSHYKAWVTGIRREEAPTRANTPVIEYDAKRDMVKLNPIAPWTQEDLDTYISDNGVLVNLLQYDGYPSIGCEPCTQRVAPGEDPRSGRWSGTGKVECGLHT
ncbi:phosphoadenylyl-sulfate reductase [Kribbella sp. NPDC051587]|uniref:phosphoadenylyl-sulfate reductase n=1 Tax=Kribbella sp. NPDC051587 TaxID=3364119 RepID=UPI003787447B